MRTWRRRAARPRPGRALADALEAHGGGGAGAARRRGLRGAAARSRALGGLPLRRASPSSSPCPCPPARSARIAVARPSRRPSGASTSAPTATAPVSDEPVEIVALRVVGAGRARSGPRVPAAAVQIGGGGSAVPRDRARPGASTSAARRAGWRRRSSPAPTSPRSAPGPHRGGVRRDLRDPAGRARRARRLGQYRDDPRMERHPGRRLAIGSSEQSHRATPSASSCSRTPCCPSPTRWP